MKCDKCGTEIFLPFKCQYCDGYFCAEHRLPENHECPQMELARMPKGDTYPVATQKVESYEHTVTYPQSAQTQKRIYFSAKEIQHLAVATLLVVGVGLSMMLFSSSFFGGSDSGYIMVAVAVAIFTVSFFIHEFAHKMVAQRSGLWAEFRLTLLGALITLISAISPIFKVISPGAVMISGYTDKKKIGEISIAGPAINIILSTIFLAGTFLLHIYTNVLALGAYFNSWISLINLIPFGVFDGFKVFSWNKKIWALSFLLAVILTLLSYQQFSLHFL